MAEDDDEEKHLPILQQLTNEQNWLKSRGLKDEEISGLRELDELDWKPFKQLVEKNYDPQAKQVPKVAKVNGVSISIGGLASLAPQKTATDDVLYLGLKMLHQNLSDRITAQDRVAPGVQPEDIYIVPPSISMTIGQSRSFDMQDAAELEEMKDVLVLPEMQKAKLLIVPVSDKRIRENDKTQDQGDGTHWRWMVVDNRNPSERSYHYYDTLYQSDFDGEGQRVANRLQMLLKERGRPAPEAEFKVHRAPQQARGGNDCGFLGIGIARAVTEEYIENPHATIGDIAEVRPPAEERTELARVVLQAASCHQAQPSHGIADTSDETQEMPPLHSAPAGEEEVLDPVLNIPVSELAKAEEIQTQFDARKAVKEAFLLDDEQLDEWVKEDQKVWQQNADFLRKHNDEMKTEAPARYADHDAYVSRGFQLYADTMTKMNRKADWNDYERVGTKAMEKLHHIKSIPRYEKAFKQFVEDDVQDQAVIERYKNLPTLEGKAKEEIAKIFLELANALDPCVDGNTLKRTKVGIFDDRFERFDTPGKELTGGQVLLFVDKALGHAYFKKPGATQRNLRLTMVPLDRINQETHPLAPGKKYDRLKLTGQPDEIVQQAKTTVKVH